MLAYEYGVESLSALNRIARRLASNGKLSRLELEEVGWIFDEVHHHLHFLSRRFGLTKGATSSYTLRENELARVFPLVSSINDHLTSVITRSYVTGNREWKNNPALSQLLTEIDSLSRKITEGIDSADR